ncbi:hypothetical protein TrVE_jg11107 [Triparma verrucosa]|uniref:A to I editase domain-containing protein n=1 Tax=Triparma verrucosa TaxID=1606542 RepID=A0A9W7C042_9STRA|nr:hypothetical protein TrVE_jg11107 [Triparma verrucosa]
MYTSSSPCGDSVVRRWGNNKSDPFLCPAAGSPMWIESTPHSLLNAQAIKQGQFALLSKGSHMDIDGGPCPPPPAFVPPPPGTHYTPTIPSTPPPSPAPHTCSDKILLRNMLGLQGLLLTHLIPTPIHLTSITIGRKYSNLHSRRALCCRSSSYRTKRGKKVTPPVSSASAFDVNHPAIIGTSVKADESLTDAPASFKSQCRVGWAGCSGAPASVEDVDGDSGRLVDGEVSKVSSSAFADLAAKFFVNQTLTLSEMKQKSPGWARKEALMNNHELFKMYAWTRRATLS